MTIARVIPYVWTSWLSKLLVGENSCDWAIWFQSHNQYFPKRQSDFDEVAWRVAHTALLAKARRELESQGKTVFVERQNSFTLKGKTGTLEGTPDLIGVGGASTICDAKTGQPRASHVAQVMIYMYAVPRAIPKYKGMKFDGLVVYNDHAVTIPADAIDDAFISNLGSLIRRITGPEPPHRVPSGSECKYCNLTEADCSDRIDDGPDGESEESTGTTEDF